MRLLHRFRTHLHGNVGVFVGLGALPLMFGVGAGIDMARLSSARIKRQDAVDAATLSVVKTSGFDQSKARAIAERMAQSNFGPSFRTPSVEFTKTGATVAADAAVPDRILKLKITS